MNMEHKVVALSGASGYLGSHILSSLVSLGFRVLVFTRVKDAFYPKVGSDILVYGITQKEIEKAFEDNHVQAVIHTACEYGRSSYSYAQLIEGNVLLGCRLLDYAIFSGAKIFINTDTFLPKNVNDYALSKLQFVEWLKNASTKIWVANIRLELMYGEGDGSDKFVSGIINKIKNNVPVIEMTLGIQKRDFIYISDVVSAFISILECPSPDIGFEEYELGTGASITIRKFVEIIVDEFEKKYGSIKSRIDFGAIPYRSNENMDVNVNIDKLRGIGWLPNVEPREGIRKIIEGLK